MSDVVGITAVAPRTLYYVAIDGTHVIDSAVFAALLEKHRGWRNLLTDFLPVAKGDASRLDDPRHPFLPICRFDQDGRRVAVVSPGGREGMGKDAFWKSYPGRDPATGRPDPVGRRTWAHREPTEGRHTAAEESSLFMWEFIRRPQVELISGGAAGTQIFGQLREGAASPGAVTYSADMIYVSSHGWLGGYAGGDPLEVWPEATPEKARHPFHASTYFSAGRWAAENAGFSGPKWIILAQCSTLNSATWPLWARILARSNPGVRGILAYEEASPKASDAVGITRAFFRLLDDKQNFLEAWKGANAGQRWAAIVHKNAIADRLDSWAAFAPLTDVSTTATIANYRGFLSGSSGGKDIFDAPAPFEMTMSISRPSSPAFWEITSANLGWGTDYCSGVICRITIRAPPGETIVRATLRWVHIRLSHSYQPSVNDLFVHVSAPDGDAIAQIVPGAQKLVINSVTQKQDALTVDLAAPAAIQNQNIVPHHSYLWPQISLTTNVKTWDYDFKTTGLLYFGA